MHLLRFTFENHKSFRDEAILDLTRSSLTTLRPPKDSTWTDHIHRVDGIYGANASGKTNVLDALYYAVSAIGASATAWLDSPSFIRKPFVLDNSSASELSKFELDFVHSGERYQFQFTTNSDGIIEETLRTVNVRWKTIFTRTSDGRVNGLSGLHLVAPRELALSRAAQLNIQTVKPIWKSIRRGFDIYRVGDREVSKRLDRIARQLHERTLSLNELVTLAQIADTGITHIEVEEQTLPPEIAKLFTRIINGKSEETIAEESEQRESSEDSEQLSEFIARNLLFRHGTGNGKLRESEESTGTMAWLALGTAVVKALRHGQVLVVDELGSSLHPQLSRLIIDWFEDPEINTTGAQLIFTSHDMTLLDAGRGNREKREQVWFVEKGSDGSSELFNLADFPLQKGSNIVKQYLEGRFGGIPYTAPSLIHNLLDTHVEEQE